MRKGCDLASQRGKQRRDSAIVSLTRLLHDEEYCRAFMVTNEKDSCSTFQNTNKRYDRPRSFHRLQSNVARTIAISPDERGDAFQFTIINFYVYERPSTHYLYFIYARKIYVCNYVNFTRQQKPTLCFLGLLGYTDRKESANEKRMKESEGLLLPFLSPLIQESDACRGSRPHSTGRIFDRLKNLTGHFVHTDFELLDG